MNTSLPWQWQCALLDPPWAERGGGKIKRGADRHYDLASTEDIYKAIVRSGEWTPAEHAHCWLWVTDSFLKDGLWLMEQLGFVYKRTYQWIKVRAEKPSSLDFETGCGFDGELTLREDGTPAVKIGIGQYARGAHEMLLLGVRGKGQDPSVWSGARDVPSVLFAPHERGADGKVIHSRKPRSSYDLIERVSVGSRIEFFARTARSGWRVWGNQAPTPLPTEPEPTEQLEPTEQPTEQSMSKCNVCSCTIYRTMGALETALQARICGHKEHCQRAWWCDLEIPPRRLRATRSEIRVLILARQAEKAASLAQKAEHRRENETRSVTST